MKPISYFVLLAMLTACAKTADYQPSNEPTLDSVIEDFQDQLLADLEDDNILGCVSAAIVKGEKIIWSKAFGVLDRLSTAKADSNTIYRVGSVTKSFTAMLMMQLEADGLLDIDEPIENFLPEVKHIKGYSDSTQISFRQLAAHTAGLQREPDWEEAYSGPIQDWEKKLLVCIPKTAFQSKPGEKYSYSNIGYGILGLALARVAGESYIELVKERIFEPLGMNNSYFVIPENKQGQLARGMEGGPFGELNLDTPQEEHQGRGYKVPNGAIYSTPNDLARFLMASIGYYDILEDAKLQLMQEPGIVEDENWWQNYGLGYRLLRDSIISTAGHTGAVSGYTANFMFEKEQEYGVVIMRNYNWGMTNIDLRAFALLRRLKRLGIE